MARFKLRIQGDKTIWIIFLLLCTISVLAVYSSSSSLAFKSHQFWAPVLKQSGFLLLGIIATFAIHSIPCRLFKLLPMLLGPFALILVAIAPYLGESVNGANRWITIAGISFQPSEIAKGVLVITVALILANMQDEKGATKKAFKWIMIFTSITCLLIAKDNISTAILLFGVIYIMMFIGKVRPLQLTILGLVCAGTICMAGVFFICTPPEKVKSIADATGFKRLPTAQQRIYDKFGIESENEVETPEEKEKTFNGLDLDKDRQKIHANIAIASSNIIGRGPGKSKERDHLSQAFSDFIYAIIIEEYGIFGGIAVLLLYLFLLFKVAYISQHCERRFPALLIMGLTLLLVFQALINMMVAVGIFPVTGQPLPLISRGGTSTILNCVYIGMILSVSEYARKKENEKNGIETVLAPSQPENFYSEENMN
ncbi:MAG: FtsW/RodA/SpoVE family cell cycle protein [Bacteroidaceae bacterium]|nr:FtsW/RodA/SpoVE family cell cycle protein [Bacteroidaceae bacterium]